MPQRYDEPGIQFQYPDNWAIEEVDDHDGRRTVSVYSPGGAFWSIVVHPTESDPAELVTAALKTMRAEYEQLDAEPAAEMILGRELVGYNLNFFCLDLTNTTLIRGFRTPEASYLILCQAEDRELEQYSLELVFRAMTTSLVASVGGGEAPGG